MKDMEAPIVIYNELMKELSKVVGIPYRYLKFNLSKNKMEKSR